ncbi:amino acid carrier protein [Dethiosulfovibrio peptidovorans DSM 11002]|uniref:Amino acid carrier protein n=1 Tax=Dethiosulfovibrio peptidovorans DSM 11002 TaxID=469381 RepID=D2Z5E9_9BACT|nr:amino acid carrier protein [Dethiosulfovibrio peptidovorans]EFC90696.1 amino acid carrier protein [Dethiosulfovibrio peptidovorans DSM 11002]
MDFLGFVEQLVDWVWGTPLIVMVLGSGVFFTLVSGCFQFRNGGYIFKNTVGQIFSGKVDDGPGLLSPYEAVSVAIGSTIGVGNIGGVATAIAVGGPGAVFWMWMAGIFGQLIKMVEVTLAVHYRTVLEDGQSTYGGPTYYIQRGLGQERGWHGLAKVLSGLFLIGFLICYFFTIQNYTVAEAVAGVFNIDLLVVSFVFLVLLYASIWGGIRGLGKIAIAVVPFMCIFYIGGALVVILKNTAAIPHTFRLIFESAFTGTAAVGGFAGAAFAKMISVGMARAVYSNEAGWGSSPMIHASAKVNHPVKQGIMGIFEVFMDTLVICSVTAIMIINSGEWSSGLDGATLTLSAFSKGVGTLGTTVLVVGIFLFGLTTSTGLFAQFETLLTYVVGPHSKNLDKVLKFNKYVYPLPGFLLVLYAQAYGLPTYKVWMFIDISIGIPIFVNLLAILLLTPKFLDLLRDYRARYMGHGKVDADFKVFYEE